MSESERAESPSASARSTHVAHFIPASWPDVASKLAALVARVDRTADAVQVVILVPSGSDATELALQLQALPGAIGARIVPLAAPRRARRLAAQARAQVIVATPATVQSLLGASAIALQGATGVGIVAASDFERDAAALELVLAELPRAATKVLVAAAPSPFVDRLIEAHMHGARRLSAAPADSGDVAPVTIELVPVAAGAPGAALADVLEGADAPSAAIIPADERREAVARAIVGALGYPDGSPLARVTPTGATEGAALVVFVGPPSPAQWANMMTTRPARIVALMSARERESLAACAAGARIIPFPPFGARTEAASAEEALRDKLKRAIGEGLPSREMLAIEPLLGEFDALVLAGAALRMFEREASRRANEAARPAVVVPPAAASNGRERPSRGALGGASRESRGEDRPRPPRTGDRAGRPPRRDDRDRPRADDRGRPPRRDDRPRAPRGDDRRPPRGSDRPTRSTSNPRDRR